MNIIFFLIITLAQSCFAEPQLQLVNVIFRHGDRTPGNKSRIPTDPNFENDYFPVGLGGLTNAGKLRSFKLGEFLRERYNEFVGDVYFPDLISAVSSDTIRTKMSLQLLLAGLFPPTQEQLWHPSLDWQPIPISYIPIQQDDLLGVAKQPAFKKEKERVMKTKDMKRRLDSFKEFMSQLSNLTQKPISTTSDVKRVYEALFFEQNMNLTLPTWSKKIFPDGKILEGALLECDIQTYDANIRNLMNGKLISKITNDILIAKNREKISKEDTRLFLYSAHDMNVNGILRSLNVYPAHIPFFSSAAIIELLKERDEYFVKVLYYHGNTTQLEELKLPGCSELCPIDEYLANVNHFLK